MSSGFSGGVPDFFSGRRRSTTNMNTSYNTMNLNPQQQFSLRSPLAGFLPDPAAQILRSESIGKRSFTDFQQQNQQGLEIYLRNVKPRPNFHHASPISPLSPVDLLSPVTSSISNPVNSRYGAPILQQLANRNHVKDVYSRACLPSLGQNKGEEVAAAATVEKNMMDHRLQELEKQLLGDEEEGEDVSVVTNSEWSETIQNLIAPAMKPISPTSSSSSCTSTSASSPPLPCSKQTLTDAAVAISEGKPENATEILTRLHQVANAWGTSEQRLVFYMLSALKARVNATAQPELYGEEHAVATQMLYDVSPCFKLGFMAANLAILEAASEQGFQKIHVVDFDIGEGGQYVHLLHALAAAKKVGNKHAAALTITAFNSADKSKTVGECLKALADKIGIPFNFHLKNSNIADLNRENLNVQPDEALAVNFAFRLYKLPDESVSTENIRDDLLRRVKRLSPTVMTVVEQEMNGNTAPIATRVREACDYYGALFESLDATVTRENPERVRIEEGLSCKMINSVACEGRDRVERCEVFGKWRARMSMAGFQGRVMSQRAAESLRSKLNSGTRGNPGFIVKEESGGGIGFGWMGRTLTVASAWR